LTVRIDHRPRRMAILAVGQSHTAAIQKAAKTHRETWPDELRTRIIHTLAEPYRSEGREFGPLARAAIQDQIARHQPRLVSMLGGNAHNMISLMRPARPYDFILHGLEEEGPPIEPDSELVPEALVRAALEERLQHDFWRLEQLYEIAGPFIHVESPPPLISEAFIRDRAEVYFRDYSDKEIVPASRGVRWRIWRLNSRILKEKVEAMGCRFMSVPPDVMDADGFLRLDLAADPTHANEAYGELLIRAIEDA